jgi:hypothetical protein
MFDAKEIGVYLWDRVTPEPFLRGTCGPME